MSARDILLAATNRTGASAGISGRFVAVGGDIAPFLQIFTYTETPTAVAFTLSQEPTECSYTIASIDFSHDGLYMAVAENGNGLVRIFKYDSGSYTNLCTLDDLPSGRATCVAFSPDGVYLATSHTASPFVTIHKRADDTFTKLANPSYLPGASGHSVAFSPNGVYLAVREAGINTVTIYKRSGDTFTRISTVSAITYISGSISFYNGIAFSADNAWLAVAHFNSVKILQQQNDVFTLRHTFNILYGSVVQLAFSPDGQMLAVGSGAEDDSFIYKLNGTSPPQLLTTPNAHGGNYVAWNASGTFVARVHSGCNRFMARKRQGNTFLEQPSAFHHGTNISYTKHGSSLAIFPRTP